MELWYYIACDWGSGYSQNTPQYIFEKILPEVKLFVNIYLQNFVKSKDWRIVEIMGHLCPF